MEKKPIEAKKLTSNAAYHCCHFLQVVNCNFCSSGLNWILAGETVHVDQWKDARKVREGYELLCFYIVWPIHNTQTSGTLYSLKSKQSEKTLVFPSLVGERASPVSWRKNISYVSFLHKVNRSLTVYLAKFYLVLCIASFLQFLQWLHFLLASSVD